MPAFALWQIAMRVLHAHRSQPVRFGVMSNEDIDRWLEESSHAGAATHHP
jgi:hypothetical protein